MSFMQKQITYRRDWWEVDGTSGIEFFDCADFTKEQAKENYSGLKVWTVEKTTGYGARLSAPGYLDCTEWSVFETEKEAAEYLLDMYGEEETEEEN